MYILERDYAALQAEPFTAYRDAWLKREISIAELLAIPRKPLFIGRVPNPEEFSAVTQDEEPDPVILQPTIDLINEALGRSSLEAASLPTWHSPGFIHDLNGEPHIDTRMAGYEGLYEEVSAIFVDREPTRYFVGPMHTAAKAITDISREETEAMANQPGVVCFQGQPYEIYAHDLTILHAGPNFNSDKTRVFGRQG